MLGNSDAIVNMYLYDNSQNQSESVRVSQSW